jgi:Icc protein
VGSRHFGGASDHNVAVPSVHLLQLTDPHLYADAGGEVRGVNTAGALSRVLNRLGDRGHARPDAIVVTGDIADDLSAAAYDRLRAMLGPLGPPVYCVPGNHDDPALMARLLDSQGFQYCGCATIGDWGLVCVDTHSPGEVPGRLPAGRLRQLGHDLEGFRDRPVVVAMHHPPVPVGSAWIDALGLVDAHAFWDVVDRHPQVRLVLAGHVHQASEMLRGQVRVATAPATCMQFMPGVPAFAVDPLPPGYRWLELRPDGTFETAAQWLDA